MPRVRCRTTAEAQERVTVETGGRRWAVHFGPAAGCVYDLTDAELEALRADLPGSCSLETIEEPTPRLNRYSFGGQQYGQTLLDLTDAEVDELPPGIQRFLVPWTGPRPTAEQQRAQAELIGRARVLQRAAAELEARAISEAPFADDVATADTTEPPGAGA